MNADEDIPAGLAFEAGGSAGRKNTSARSKTMCFQALAGGRASKLAVSSRLGRPAPPAPGGRASLEVFSASPFFGALETETPRAPAIDRRSRPGSAAPERLRFQAGGNETRPAALSRRFGERNLKRARSDLSSGIGRGAFRYSLAVRRRG